MPLTLRSITKRLWAGYGFGGHVAKDLATNWAKTCTVQPQGTTTLAAAGAMPITHSSVVCTTAGTYAWTLANGKPGQIICITLGTATSGAGTLTPTTATGWATAVFTVVGDGATFMYVDDTVGWVLVGAYGTTSSTAGTVISL